MAEKLTKAQRRFLGQLEQMSGASKPGFDSFVLRGAESAMARRLQGRGLVAEEFQAMRGPFWNITPAGRLALQQEGREDG